MQRIILFLFFLYFFVNKISADVPQLQKAIYDAAGNVIEFPGIRNAEFVKRGEFQSFVGIQGSNGKTMCGGVLLDVDFILTTASCVANTTNLTVWNDAINGTDSDRSRMVQQTFIHPRFSADTMQHDIAVLNISPYKNVSELLTAIEVLPSQNCSMIGWGRGVDGDFLYKIKAAVATDENCNSEYGQELGNGMMCVQSMNNSCLENGGSALLCDGEVAGILSYGHGCRANRKPNVFTDVSKYNDWIDEVFRTSIEDRIQTSSTTMRTTTRTTRTTTRTTTRSTTKTTRTTTRRSTTGPTSVQRPELEVNKPSDSFGFSQPKETYEIVADVCTAPFTECYPVWLNFITVVTQCRRGYYKYGCFYVVKRYTEESRVRTVEPNHDDFKQYLQTMNPRRITVIQNAIQDEPEIEIQEILEVPQVPTAHEYFLQKLRCIEALANNIFNWPPPDCTILGQRIDLQTQKVNDDRIYFPLN